MRYYILIILSTMMINVSGSLSVINNIGKAFEDLNPENLNSFQLNVNSSSQSFSHDSTSDTLDIGLINLDAAGEFYNQILESEEALAITLVDNGSSKNLDALLDHNLLTTRILGLQSHCTKSPLYEDNEKVFRLKDIRLNPDISEIVLRTSDIAIFNLNAIRRGDQCGNLKSNTTGFTIEEACLISKFIGASELIRKVYFVGLNFNNDIHNMMTTNIANMLWYISEGVKLRSMDQDIADPDNLVFSVVADPIEKELQFVKSAESGRWWVKVPTEEGHMHMACSIKDYEMACNNEISDRISKALDSII